MKYCSQCKAVLKWCIPEGDTHHRYVCPDCQTIHYANPKVIVGTLPIWEEEKILLCLRAIEPQKGLWTLPAGFMENGETAQEGAVRETMEEANARISIEYLHTLYSIPHISQVHLLFKAKLLSTDFSAGPETLEACLFLQEEIPWKKIAFRPVLYCLQHFAEDIKKKRENEPADWRTYCGSF